MADGPPRPSRAHSSLRFRLTLWVVAVFAVIQISLGLILLLYQRVSIDSLLTDRLGAETEALARDITDRAHSVTDEGIERLADQRVDFVLFDQVSLALFDDAGLPVAASHPDSALLADQRLAPALSDARSADLRFPVDALPEAHPGASQSLVALRPLTGADGQRYTLMVATADTYAQRLFAASVRVVLLMLALGLVAAALSAWFIAGLAVAPIRNLRRVAEGLSAASIDESVHLDSSASEVERLENELEAARKRLSAAFHAQERFMSNVSHELKTPISVLLTEAQVVDLDQPEDREAFVHSVQEELRRLGWLIESFLMLTRVREGGAINSPAPCQVNDVVLESVSECAAWARQRGVFIEPALIESEDDVDAAVAGDPHLLRTMVNNLVFNAIRFSPPGERVEVAAEAGDGPVRISVRDHGPGIPAEMLDNLFDRFAMCTPEHQRGRGNGLGLKIAKGIAELHGGDIAAHNCPDEGARFVIELPRRGEDPAGPAPEVNTYFPAEEA